MSVCAPYGGMHSLWAGQWTPQVFAPISPAHGSSETERAAYLDEFSSLIDDTVAAVIIEPIAQGAGGMRFHDHELVAGLKKAVRSKGDFSHRRRDCHWFWSRRADLGLSWMRGYQQSSLTCYDSLTTRREAFSITYFTLPAACATRQGFAVWAVKLRVLGNFTENETHTERGLISSG